MSQPTNIFLPCDNEEHGRELAETMGMKYEIITTTSYCLKFIDVTNTDEFLDKLREADPALWFNVSKWKGSIN
jgi:hypothetical protein